MCFRVTQLFDCGHQVPDVWKCEDRPCGKGTKMAPRDEKWLARARSGEEPSSPLQCRAHRRCNYCKAARPWFFLFFICLVSCIFLLVHYGCTTALYVLNLIHWDLARWIWRFEEILGALLLTVAFGAHGYVRYLSKERTRRARPYWPPSIPQEFWIHGRLGW